MNNKNNIISEELREIAPHLADFQRVNPFSVPVHYFETLPGEVMQTILATELQLLDSLKKENAFNVPYNYFESLPGKILNRVREEENKPTFAETILNKLGYLLKPKYAFAALALVIGITIFISKKNSNPSFNIPTLAAAEKQVTAQDMKDYISSNIDQFDETSIVACVSNKQLDNAPFPMTSIDSLNIDKIDLSQIDDNTINEIAM